MAASRLALVTALLLGLVYLASCQTPASVIRTSDPNCMGANGYTPSPNSTSSLPITKTIVLWQSIVLLICFGAFALFICLIHRIIRTYVYYDAHLLDTFFDAGGDSSFALVACSLVAKWTWTYSFSQSTTSVMHYGLVGHFWTAAGMAIHLFLFSIVAAEIRIKAPGAKTFLQVIRARYGAFPHITIMVFAFLTNILIAGMVMMEGVNMLTAVADGLGREVACIVLAIVIGFFTVVGGVGGFMYVSYFGCALIISIMLVFFCDVFYDPLSRTDNQFGHWEDFYKPLSCGRGDDENEKFSLLTFISKNGMIYGILTILSSFSAIFVNQSFWQTAIAAKPTHAVWGFISGGLAWFAIPFCAAFVFGMSYWRMAVEEGHHLVTEMAAKEGLLPMFISQKLLGNTGDFLMFVVIMVAVITTCSGEVLSSSSIILYDIYQTYIAPFRSTPIPEGKNMSMRMLRAITNEEYLEYDRRCMVLKHVVVVSVTCLLIPITLVLLAIGIDIQWLFMFTAVVVGSCVMPIAFAITWHRITGPGVATGALGGFAAAFIAWLVVASTKPGGLENFRENTGDPYVFLVGISIALGAGGLLCVVVSLPCGGCDADLHEEEEWEKTRSVSNPIMPWEIRYASDIGAGHLQKGKPHYLIVRRAYKTSEICAYIFGVLLAVCAVLVWPACMLIAEIFSSTLFEAWVLVVLIWTAVSAAFLIIVPLLYEVIQTCRQAYYNRMWTHATHGERLTEEPSEPSETPKHEPPPPAHHTDSRSIKSESDYGNSTMGAGSSSLDRNKLIIDLE